MSDTTCQMSISLDGFVAGPDQSADHPLGVGGHANHAWHMGDPRQTEANATAAGWLMRPRGAYVMGRNMFGPIRGAWKDDWRGWWGAEPPYHAPVFVLTNHARESFEMEGCTRRWRRTSSTAGRADVAAGARRSHARAPAAQVVARPLGSSRASS